MSPDRNSSLGEGNAPHLRKWVTGLGIKGVDQLFAQSQALGIAAENFGPSLEAYVADFIDRHADKLIPLVKSGILERPRKRRAAEQQAAAVGNIQKLSERQRSQLGEHVLDEKGKQFVYGQGMEGKTFFAAAEHCIFGAMLVEMIGQELGWDDQRTQEALYAFLLHDAAKPLETQLRENATQAGEGAPYEQQCALLWEAYEQCGTTADAEFAKMGVPDKVIALAHANDFRHPSGRPYAGIQEMSEQERVVAFMDQMIRDTSIVSVDERIGNARRKGPENVWVKLAKGGQQKYPEYNRDLEQQNKTMEAQTWLHDEMFRGSGIPGELPFRLQEMFVSRIMDRARTAQGIPGPSHSSTMRKVLSTLFNNESSVK